MYSLFKIFWFKSIPENSAVSSKEMISTSMPSSGDSHPALFSSDVADPDDAVSFAFYNIGIQNNEVGSKNWNAKIKNLKDDLARALGSEHAVQGLLITEFGNMFDSIDKKLLSLACKGGVSQPTLYTNTFELFTVLLLELNLPNFLVFAHPPYIALIDKDYWHVESGVALDDICTKTEFFVQHLMLRHTRSNRQLRIFNAHMPTSVATNERKKKVFQKMCSISSSGVLQPTDVWMFGGDMNCDVGTMMKHIQPFIVPHVACISKSGFGVDLNAQKADFAVSQGIDILQVRSWVGWHSRPCVSDAHDLVLVSGVTSVSMPKIGMAKIAGHAEQDHALSEQSGKATGSGSVEEVDTSGVAQPAEIDYFRSQSVIELIDIYEHTAQPVAQESVPSASSGMALGSKKVEVVENSGITRPAEFTDVERPIVVELIDTFAGQAQEYSSLNTAPHVLGERRSIGAGQVLQELTTSEQRGIEVVETSGVTQPAGITDVVRPIVDSVIDTFASQAQDESFLPIAHCLPVNEDEATFFGRVPIKLDPDAGQAIQERTTGEHRGIAAGSYSGEEVHNSGVAQPTENQDGEHQIVVELIDTLADRAQDDSSPNIANAAQDIMATLYATGSGVAIRSRDEILQAMVEPIRRRREFVLSMATTRQNEYNAYYSEQDWIQWLSTHPLSDFDMDDAVQKWKSDFVANHMIKKTKVDELLLLDSRASKKEARSLINGAWKSYVRDCCISVALATAFLKHPPAAVDTLLAAWVKLMSSDEFALERARSAKVQKGLEKAEAEKLRQVELKIKVYKLRHIRRQMVALVKKKRENLIQSIPESEKVNFERFMSGALDDELDALTIQHGYGKLRKQDKLLQAVRLSDVTLERY
jgi:hypothetical protein